MTTPDRPSPNAFNLDVDQDEGGWCLSRIVDGERRVISRHRSEEAARQALVAIDESARRDSDDTRR